MKYILLLPIRFYRKFISPLFGGRCKYSPTCSKYAEESVMRFGFFKGGAMAFWRILRCNPWSLGGIDPVPEKKKQKKKRR